MNIALLINPIITPTIVAIFASALTLIILIKSRAAIGQQLAGWRARIFTRTGFFWLVNIVFMGVSVLHAGAFFGIAGKDDLAHYLGFAVSFFLDLVTIILMQALLEARYRGDENRGRQFLFFITICCGTSTFANLAISLNDFDPSLYLKRAPEWVQVASPYVLASFPLFVIMMSIAAEMIINVRPLEQLDEKEYEQDEKKRLKIMEIRNTYLQKQADEELRALTIRAQMRAQKPGFQWWPWTTKNEDINVLISRSIEQAQSAYSRQINDLKTGLQDEFKTTYEQEINDLKMQLEEALSRQEDDLSDVFKRPIDMENWRYRDAYTDDSSDLQEDFISDACVPTTSPINLAPSSLEELSDDATPVPITEPIGTPTSYSQIAEQWFEQGIKSVSVKDIVEVTGLSGRKVQRNKYRFAKTPKNENLYTVRSVLHWLKDVLQENVIA